MAYDNTSSEKDQAVWNIDDEILKIIRELKVLFLRALIEMKLEDAYMFLDLICGEEDAKLTDTESKEIEGSLKVLEEQRQEYLKDMKKNGGAFFIQLRTLYKRTNKLMKEHGIWFREQEDDVGL